MKKALSFIICIALIISALPLTVLNVLAQTDGYYTYTVEYNEAIITGVDESISGDIMIPKTLGGYTVSEIGDYAFENCVGITGVTFHNDIRTVGKGAFEGCTNITKVNTTDISEWCDTYFENNTANPIYYAQKLFLNGEEVTDMVIPEGKTGIGQNTFNGCKSLNSVTLPNSMVAIWSSAFANCDSLTEITFGNSVEIIEGNVFYNCPKLKKVNITDIEKWCAIDFEYESSNPLYYGAELYLNNTLVTDLVIPSGVISIGNNAFYNCVSLKNVTLADSVETIGYYTFYGCTSLESVTLSKALTDIPARMFGECTSLKSVTLPDSVENIGAYAFEGCVSLEKIALPSSVKTVETYAFNGCDSLSGVYITDVYAWCSIAFGDYHSNPLEFAEKLYLNNQLVTELEIPNGVYKIGKNAFNGCTSLEKVTMPESVESIESFAFNACTSLKNIIISEGVESIGTYAFADCQTLAKINIPSSVTEVSSNAFYGCYALEGVYITNVAAWCNIEFDSFNNIATNPLKTGAKLYLNNEQVTDLVVPDGVTKIGGAAFEGCYSIKNVYVSDTVERIGKDAFSGTAWFENQPDGLVYAGKVAYKYRGTAPETVTLKDGTTGIADDAFSGQLNIKNINIPDSVRYIGNNTFSGCYALENIDIGDNVTEIGEYAFAWCDALVSVNLGNSLKRIGEHAFYGCSFIKAVTIPKTLESVGKMAFSGTYSLADVYYRGSQLDAYNLSIPSGNDTLNSAAWHYNACIFAAEHSYSGICDTDCNLCGLEREAPEHVFDENQVCENCGYTAYIIGDVSGDKKVTTTDLALLKLYLAGIGELEGVGQLGADLSGDGDITTTDLALLKLYLAQN